MKAKYMSEIWDQPVEQTGRMISILRDMERQDNIRIVIRKINKQINKRPLWKSPGPDGVQGYWLKDFTSFHVVCE